MFTPPPSPDPRSQNVQSLENQEKGRTDGGYTQTPITAPICLQSTTDDGQGAKAAMTRKIRWSVLIVPSILILVALSTQYISHPPFFDLLSDTPSHWPPDSVGGGLTHLPHKRQAVSLSNPLAGPSSTGSAVSASSTSPTSTISISQTQQPIPTVPSAPPVLPTPFPQPLDSTLSSNFSTQGCQAFFLNMTSTEAFRTCRPFSLLQQSSSAFIQAQTNLTLLNTVMWGTCNTTPTKDQCISNMAWFAQQLQTACSIDLKDRVQVAADTLNGLQAYSVMRDAGCSISPSTNTYCYVNAAHNSNPSDFYYYLLPLGDALPNNTKTCSACTQTLLNLYDQAMTNNTALQKTYPPAAKLAQSQCGATFAVANAASLPRRRIWGWSVASFVSAAALNSVLL